MPAEKLVGGIALFGKYGEVRVKYKDIFDLKEFYKALKEYLLEHEWKAYDGSKEEWETYYGERIPQGGAREIWILWRLKKKAQQAPISYYWDFEWHCLAITKTEVVREGRKMAVNKGEVELKIKPYMSQDYLKGLESDSVLKHFKNLVSKRIYKKDVEKHKKILYQETYALQNFIKQWFKLKRYLPYEETKTFFPSYAWPSHLKE